MEEASAKLSSQRERLVMYTSGAGFGVGDDSSVDVDDDSESTNRNEDDESYCSSIYDGGSDVGAEAGPGLLFGYEDMNISGFDEREEIPDNKLWSAQPPDEDVPTFSPTDEGIKTVLETDGGGARIRSRGDTAECYFETKDSFAATTDESSAAVDLRCAGALAVRGGTVNSTPCLTSPTWARSVPRNISPSVARNMMTTEGQDCRSPPVAKLFKIPPPPPEKIRQWEESKRAEKQLLFNAKLSSK